MDTERWRLSLTAWHLPWGMKAGVEEPPDGGGGGLCVGWFILEKHGPQASCLLSPGTASPWVGAEGGGSSSKVSKTPSVRASKYRK